MDDTVKRIREQQEEQDKYLKTLKQMKDANKNVMICRISRNNDKIKISLSRRSMRSSKETMMIV